MAKNYRSTVTNNDKNLGGSSTPTLIGLVRPLDGEQAPGAYLKSLKISIQQRNQNDTPQAFLIYASTNDTWDDNDVITAQATGVSGGTVWLSLNRRIRSYTEETDRSDGPVYIFARAMDMGLVGDVETNIFLECWGRYVILGAQ